jgi:hypothetical protein
MIYNLGNYRYKNGSIYRKVWWIFYKRIIQSNFNYLKGVRIVNNLALGDNHD